MTATLTAPTLSSTVLPGRTAIYVRLSDDRGDGAGVDRQLTDCEALVSRRAWGPARVYADDSVSAFSGKRRPQYQRLLEDVRSGDVGRVVVYHVDRLYRRTRELLDLIDLADAGRVEVVTVYSGEIDLGTSDGRFVAKTLVNVAEKSSEDGARRVMRRQADARDAGLAHGGPRPFGWLATPDDQRRSWDPYRHDPVEAGLIRDAVRDVLAGTRITDVAKRWNAAGVRQPRGELGWGPTGVRVVLTSPRNAGLVTYRGDVVGVGTWPAIIDRATWERVCAELDRRRAGYTTERRQRTLLSGVLVCGLCGTPLIHGRTRGTKVYRCKRAPGSRGCGRIQIAAEALDRDMTAAVLAYVDTADLAAMASPEQHAEAASVAAGLAELERDAQETADLAAAGTIRPADFARYSSGVAARQRVLRHHLTQLTHTSVLEPYAGRGGALAAAWERLTVDQRRAIIAAAFGRLVVGSATRGGGYDLARVKAERGALG